MYEAWILFNSFNLYVYIHIINFATASRIFSTFKHTYKLSPLRFRGSIVLVVGRSVVLSIAKTTTISNIYISIEHALGLNSCLVKFRL